MRWLKIIAMLGLSGTALWWAYRSADVGRVLQLLVSADKGWVAASLGLLILANLVHCGRLSLLLSAQGAAPDFRSLIRLHWIGLLFSIMLPAQLGLDAARIRYGRQFLSSRWHMVPIVLLDRLIGSSAISLCACVALWVLPSVRVQTWLFIPPLLLLLVSIGLLFVVTGHSRPADEARSLSWVRRILHVIRFPLPEQSERNSWHLDLIFRTGFLATVQYALMSSAVAVLAKALHVPTSLFPLAVGFPIIAVLTMILPISINGIGVREAMFLIVYRPLGLRQEEALALAAFWLGLLLLNSCLGAIPLLMSSKPAQ